MLIETAQFTSHGCQNMKSIMTAAKDTSPSYCPPRRAVEGLTASSTPRTEFQIEHSTHVVLKAFFTRSSIHNGDILMRIVSLTKVFPGSEQSSTLLHIVTMQILLTKNTVSPFASSPLSFEMPLSIYIQPAMFTGGQVRACTACVSRGIYSAIHCTHGPLWSTGVVGEPSTEKGFRCCSYRQRVPQSARNDTLEPNTHDAPVIHHHDSR